jgi:hypothetical protein
MRPSSMKGLSSEMVFQWERFVSDGDHTQYPPVAHSLQAALVLCRLLTALHLGPPCPLCRRKDVAIVCCESH